MGKNEADCCRIKLSMSKYGSHSALLLTMLCGDQDVWSALDPGRDVQMLHKMGIPLPPWPDQPVDIAQHGIIPTILAAKWLILNHLPGCGQITLSATLSTWIRHLSALGCFGNSSERLDDPCNGRVLGRGHKLGKPRD